MMHRPLKMAAEEQRETFDNGEWDLKLAEIANVVLKD